jgi:hypothetical protein
MVASLPELRNGKIGAIDSLAALFAHNANSHIRRLQPTPSPALIYNCVY